MGDPLVNFPVLYSLGSQASVVDIKHAFHLYYKCCMWAEFQSISTWLRGFSLDTPVSSLNSISATFNQSYLNIPTLPNDLRHSRYKAMHDGWSLAFMKSTNHDQTWRQKSLEMFASKLLKNSIAAMIQLFRVSQKLISRSFLSLEMLTKSRRSLYLSCWRTWVPLLH